MRFLLLFLFVVNVFAKSWSDENNFADLLHYVNGKSLVINDEFFLTKNGKTNLEAELLALKKSYNLPKTLGNKHPRCLFPDRYFWLNKQIKLDNYQPVPKFCKNLNNWYSQQKTHSISALLVGGYFSNPASVFGHNLLKLNTKEKSLFDETINFGAAIPANENSISYIFKGLFGGYTAKFNSKEFYARDLVYAKNELRDIWDYELNLTRDEITLIKLHIWSLDNKEFDYYFLKENCAYQLASIVNLVVDMELPQQTPWYIPVEFVNKLDEKNKVRKITYYPSSEKVLFDKFANLSDSKIKILNDIIHNKKITRDKKLLDLALDYYNYILIDNNDKKLKTIKNKILINSLKLPPIKQDDNFWQTTHSQLNPNNLTLSIDKDYLYTQFSIFNNDLFANDDGVELVAPTIKLKLDKDENIEFESLNIANIVKLNKYLKNFPEQKISWQINFGIKNLDDKIKPHLKAGIGKVLYSNDNIIFWSMADALVNQDTDEFSTRASINLLVKNNFADILLKYNKNLESGADDFYYKIQKPLTKNNSIFIDNVNDNIRLGVNFRF